MDVLLLLLLVCYWYHCHHLPTIALLQHPRRRCHCSRCTHIGSWSCSRCSQHGRAVLGQIICLQHATCCSILLPKLSCRDHALQLPHCPMGGHSRSHLLQQYGLLLLVLVRVWERADAPSRQRPGFTAKLILLLLLLALQSCRA